MNKFTLAERALLHLYRYRHVSPAIEIDAPREMTQTGVAEALGISRSHASLITARLEQEGKIYAGKSRIIGQNRGGARKIYFITPLGRETCEELRRTMEAQGITEDDLLVPYNINYCSSSAFWSLPPEERAELGCLLVLRVPVSRRDFRSPPSQLVPFDFRGYLAIKPETRRWYLQRADVESLRSWHSAAADWCMDRRCDPKERLYHLYRSGRKREAARLASSQRFMLMDFPDSETRDIVSVLADEFSDPELCLTSARMSLRLGETRSAMSQLESSRNDLGTSGDALRSEIMLAEGETASALDEALDAYVGDVDTAAALGLCMVANGRYEEALTYLRRCRGEMRRTGCLFRLDEILSVQAKALRCLGATAEAEASEAASQCWRKDPLVPDVRDTPLEHRQPLETESPGQDGRVYAERRDDFRPEDAGASELHPLAVEEHLELEGRLRVGEVRGADADLVEAHPRVELADHRDEHVEVGVLVDDDALDLGELGQMGGVDGLLPEYAGDGERLPGRVGMLRDVADAAHGAVRAEQGHLGLIAGPCASPSGGTGVAAVLMDGLDHGDQALVVDVYGRGVLQIERVLEVPGGMVLGRVEHIQVPEGGLDVLGLHLGESHVGEQPADLRPEAGEHVLLGGIHGGGEGLDVVGPEVGLLPLSALDHAVGDVGDLGPELYAG